MATCGKRYGFPARICCLDAGHADGCAGQIDPAVRRNAKQQAQRLHLEGSVQAPGITAPAFADRILAALQQLGGGACTQQVAKHLGPLVVNGQPAKAREIRQMAWRLVRDGRLCGDDAGWRLPG